MHIRSDTRRKFCEKYDYDSINENFRTFKTEIKKDYFDDNKNIDFKITNNKLITKKSLGSNFDFNSPKKNNLNFNFDLIYDDFEKEDSEKYKFVEIPKNYCFSENNKLLYEVPRFDGTFVRFYENFTVEIRLKNDLIHRIFLDGCIISSYPNKDIRIIFPNGDIFYKFRAIDITEFIQFNKFSFITYKHEIVEKILKEGLKLIKNPFNSDIKIILLNDQEYKKKDGEFIQRRVKVKIY